MKLLALIPLGFAGTFLFLAISIWADTFRRPSFSEKMEYFGMAWGATIAFLVTGTITSIIIIYVPWVI